MSFVDVSNLKKLHSLSLTRNAGLDEIYGLDSLQELWELDCIGNESLTRIENLNEIIMNNEDF